MSESKRKGVSRRDVLKTAAVLGLGGVVGLPNLVRGANLKEIKVGYQLGAQLHQWMYPLGKEKKLYEEAGFSIKGQEYASVGIMAQHLAVNEMDFGLMGLTAVMLAKAQGSDVVIVGTQNQGGSALVVAPEIKKFEDLKNLPVGHTGVGAVQHALLTQMTTKFNTPVKMVTVKPTDMVSFAKNGEVKAVQVYEPFAAMVSMQLPGWKRLILDTDILPGNQCCVIATSKSFAKKHPDIVEQFLIVNVKTTKEIRSNPEESIRIIAKASGYDEAITGDAYKYMTFPWPPVINETSSKTVLSWLVDSGKIDPALMKPNMEGWWKDLYDPTFENKLQASGLFA
jgi:ABC-type nitrate/sulfonate/bicarbonate transport system substrate-binding protein